MPKSPSSGRTRKHSSISSSSRDDTSNIRPSESSSSSSSSRQPSPSIQHHDDSDFDPDTESNNGTKRSKRQYISLPATALPELVGNRDESIQKLKDCINKTLKTYFCKPDPKTNEEEQQGKLTDVLIEGFTQDLIGKIVQAAEDVGVDSMDGNWSKSGLYFFLEKKKNGEVKCGMTFGQDFGERLDQQKDRIAKAPMKLFTVDDAKHLIDDDLAEKVMNAYSTPWHHDDDRKEYVMDLIKLQILEGYCTCIWNFKTGVIFELLFQVPARLVRFIFAPTTINKEALKHLRKESTFFLSLTSSTLRCDLLKAVEDGDTDLEARMPEVLKFGFTKNMLFNHLFTPEKIIGWESAVTASAAWDDCKNVADELIKMMPDGFDPSLSWSEPQKEKVIRLFATFEDYDTHKPTDHEVLGEGVNSLLPRVINKLATSNDHNDNGILVLEHESLRGLQALKKFLRIENLKYSSEVDPDELEDGFDLPLGNNVHIRRLKATKKLILLKDGDRNDQHNDSDIKFGNIANLDIQELVPKEEFFIDLGGKVHLRKHKQSQRLVLVTPAFFLMFAPPGTETSPSKRVRLMMARAFVILLDHLAAAGCISEDHAQKIRSRLQTYIMSLHRPFYERDEVEDCDEYLGEYSPDQEQEEYSFEGPGYECVPVSTDGVVAVNNKKESLYSYYSGRLRYSKNGYYKPLPPNVRNVANNIGKGIPGHMLQGVQHHATLARVTVAMREAYGWTTTPLDPNWFCIGGCDNYKPPRERDRHNPQASKFRYVCYTGRKWPGFPLDNTFLCQYCCCGYYKAALRTHFANKKKAGGLTKEESDEYDRLEAQREAHNAYVRAHPKPKEVQLAQSRDFQLRTAGDTEKREELARKQRARHQEQGTVREKQPTNFIMIYENKSFKYPEGLQAVLRRIFRRLIRVNPVDTVSSIFLTNLFRAVVDRYLFHNPSEAGAIMPVREDDKKTYYATEMNRIAESFMTKTEEAKKKTWTINNFDEALDRRDAKAKNLKGEATFVNYILDAVIPRRPPKRKVAHEDDRSNGSSSSSLAAAKKQKVCGKGNSSNIIRRRFNVPSGKALAMPKNKTFCTLVLEKIGDTGAYNQKRVDEAWKTLYHEFYDTNGLGGGHQKPKWDRCNFFSKIVLVLYSIKIYCEDHELKDRASDYFQKVYDLNRGLKLDGSTTKRLKEMGFNW